MTLELKNTFLTKCIPARGLLAAAVYYTPAEYMSYWLFPAGIATTVNTYKYLKHSDDEKGVFGQKVQWNHMRPFHIIILIIFIVLIAQQNYEYSKYIPIIDLAVGTVFMLSQYNTVM